MTEKLPFFVYGTLRLGEYNYDRCIRGHYTDVKTGKIQANMYDFGCPVIVRSKKDNFVVGDVFFIDDTRYEYVLNNLDVLEGYDGTKYSLYTREKVDVELEDGSIIECWAYFGDKILKDSDTSGFTKIECGDWIEYNELKEKNRKRKKENVKEDDLFDPKLTEEEYYNLLFNFDQEDEEDYETPWRSIPFKSEDEKRK